MTRFYIAGAFRRQTELRLASTWLERWTGFVCVASWLSVEASQCCYCDGKGMTDDVRCAFCGGAGDVTELDPAVSVQAARQDLTDIDAADVVFAFTEQALSTASRGGRHVELGYAIARRKRVIVIGPPENIFCHLVPCVPNIRQALQLVMDGKA